MQISAKSCHLFTVKSSACTDYCCKGWTIIRNLRQIGNHCLATGDVTPGGPSFGWRKHFDPYSGRLLVGS